MKKKLALLLAAVMVAAMVPVTAMAASKNQVSKVLSVTSDTYTEGQTELVITEQDGLTASGLDNKELTFALNLTGAKWAADKGADVIDKLTDTTDGIQIAGTTTNNQFTLTVNKITDTMITVSVKDLEVGDKPKFIIPLYTQVTGAETAEVEVDGMSSNLKSETLTFAKVVSGATTASIESVTNIDTGKTAIKSIVIKENVAGTIKNTGNGNKPLTLKLYGNFEFTSTQNVVVTDVATGAEVGKVTGHVDKDAQKVEIDLSTVNASKKSQLVISGITLTATDDAVSGDEAEIYISGAGTTSESLIVAKYVEYGVVVSVEDKDLPVIYAGTANETKTLKVTLKENVAGSWLANRKTTFKFPEGIKVKEIIVDKNTGVGSVSPTTFTANGDTNNTLTLSGVEVEKNGNALKKVTLTTRFVLLAAPNFEGDVTLTVGGAALAEDTELKVATVKPLFTVETEINEVKIDYRNTKVADLVIKETKAGALAKNNGSLVLQAEDMTFEDGSKYEVVEGDIKIDSVKVTRDGFIKINVKSASVKTPSTIKLSNLSLYMSRNLPAGDYRLYSVVGDGKASNFATYGPEDGTHFDTKSVTLLNNYVTVVTAGRDQDDSTFTTTVKVTIGANTMTAGTKTIDLDAPAYISNGYTMLPVRAVAEALSGSAQVSWDDATKTVIIFFGSRIIKMTIGSKEMIINGTPTTMQAPAEITNSRTFISLRDLAYALGLNDDKIAWDDATKTATLN